MAYWVWILVVVGLSILAWGIFAFSIHVMHRQVPARQVAQGDPEDLSTPLPMDIAREQDSIEAGDAMTAREIEEEHREKRKRVATRIATYELALPGARSRRPFGLVAGVPPAEVGDVFFHEGGFWRVDGIEPAQSSQADGLLIVSRTTNLPSPTTA